MNILLINGPNLNLLGTREPEIYGSKTLNDIENDLSSIANDKIINLECFQSNHEGEIVDKIQDSIKNVQGILINAGAFTHTSISIRDALIGSKIPFVELHISNIFSREEFRKESFLTDKAIGIISGFGISSYSLGLYGIIEYLKNKK
ncbi:Dehydroquinase class II [Prochlorococcus marinus str. MIT 9515]|uniref:3-dehydroquinate dehydratase n=1 Tax=Prochlorococcus marinus (strain MIT 9515) TaxID=167542 RepID=AROQ_PROM5|nr:type II 3-dehydroquinate dehydratase [Prochlorococcus marinus]A2BV47.1 RecName: Full=3-dehydroquinate dehydratase; Short=3-dehydroquinase; AltName: Full=Type II DHQase [Prochlorococcus marinus str. MIT 9515]ABM71658.1 Dehydroquinase class II [Prochlorococcus marinus str. MIT 9515]